MRYFVSDKVVLGSWYNNVFYRSVATIGYSTPLGTYAQRLPWIWVKRGP